MTTTTTTTTSRALLARRPARRAALGAGARRPSLRAQSSGRDVADAFGALAASVHGDDDDGDGVVFDDHAILEAANAVESPLFNDAFRDALRDANARMSEEKREEKEKIDREVQEIMARVREERAARAGVSAGAAVPAAAVATAAVATAAAAPTPAPTPTPTPTPEALDAADEFSNMLRDELMEMKKSSEKTLNSLAQARDRLVEAIAREERKLGRTEMLLNTVQREARYRRADRAAAARKQQK